MRRRSILRRIHRGQKFEHGEVGHPLSDCDRLSHGVGRQISTLATALSTAFRERSASVLSGLVHRPYETRGKSPPRHLQWALSEAVDFHRFKQKNKVTRLASDQINA
jgi:hypothetical protein